MDPNVKALQPNSLPGEVVVTVGTREDAVRLRESIQDAKSGEEVAKVLDKWTKESAAKVLTDEELKKELELRAEKRKEETVRVNEEYLGRLEKVLTIEVINALVPYHSKSVCSDKDTSNGFGSNGMSALPRCNRCALIEIMGGTGRKYVSPDSLINVRLVLEMGKAF